MGQTSAVTALKRTYPFRANEATQSNKYIRILKDSQNFTQHPAELRDSIKMIKKEAIYNDEKVEIEGDFLAHAENHLAKFQTNHYLDILGDGVYHFHGTSWETPVAYEPYNTPIGCDGKFFLSLEDEAELYTIDKQIAKEQITKCLRMNGMFAFVEYHCKPDYLLEGAPIMVEIGVSLFDVHRRKWHEFGHTMTQEKAYDILWKRKKGDSYVEVFGEDNERLFLHEFAGNVAKSPGISDEDKELIGRKIGDCLQLAIIRMMCCKVLPRGRFENTLFSTFVCCTTSQWFEGKKKTEETAIRMLNQMAFGHHFVSPSMNEHAKWICARSDQINTDAM